MPRGPDEERKGKDAKRNSIKLGDQSAALDGLDMSDEDEAKGRGDRGSGSGSDSDSDGGDGGPALNRTETQNVQKAQAKLAAAVATSTMPEADRERSNELRAMDRRASAAMTDAEREEQDRMEEAANIDDEEAESRRGMLIEAFSIFDTDKGGFIELSELTSILNLCGFEDGEDCNFSDVGDRLGMADDGQCTLDEFMDAMERFVYELPPRSEAEKPLQEIYNAILRGDVAKLKLAFEACDADGSGEIDRDELKLVMESLGESLSDKELDAMFSELDSDGGGEIDFDEFVTFMCRRNAGALRGKAKSKSKFFNVNALAQISSFMADKKISEEESDATMAEMPFLEKLGAGYMKDYYRKKELRTEEKLQAGQDAELHILTKDERRALKRVERWTLFGDVMFGLISALVAGVAELFASDWWNTDGTEDSAGEYDGRLSWTKRVVYFWLLVGGVSIVISIIEVMLIYYIHLKAAVRISRITGLKLFPVDKERAFVTAALARAALELPHPNTPEYGINPLAEASELKLAVAAIAYKAKTGVSTFIIRLLLKRVLIRVALKQLLFFAAAPVQMFWNFLVGYTVLRATRVVSLGPSAAVELSSALLRDRRLTATMKEGIIRAIAVIVVAKELLHPNIRILLQNTVKVLGMEDEMTRAELPKEVVETDGMPLTKEQQERRKLGRPVLEAHTSSRPDGDEEDASSSSDNLIQRASNADGDQEASPDVGDMVALAVDVDTAESGDGSGAVELVPTTGGDVVSASSSSVRTVAEQIEEDIATNESDCYVPEPGNVARFATLLTQLNPPENRTDKGIANQQFLLEYMALALVLDGFVSKKVTKLWSYLTGIIQLNQDPWPLHFLTFKFLRGELSSHDLLDMFDEDVRLRNDAAGVKGKCRFYCDRCAVCISC